MKRFAIDLDGVFYWLIALLAYSAVVILRGTAVCRAGWQWLRYVMGMRW